MKILFSADWQFDNYARLSKPTSSGLTSRLEDIAVCWRWMDGLATIKRADAIIVAGDLFNNRTSVDLPVLDTVCRLVNETSVPVAILAGNHDSHLRTPTINSIQALRGVATVVEKLRLQAWKGLNIAYIPWTDDLTSLREGVDAAIAWKADILVAHALVEGAVPMGGGIPLEYFKPQCFKRVFLGDVHDALDLVHGDGNCNVHYIASPLQLDYRDAGRWRGVLLYNAVTDKIERIENTVSPKFHVVKQTEDLDSVQESDFIRVSTTDDEDGKALTESAHKLSSWVESSYVEMSVEAPRMEVSMDDKDADILERYVRYVRPGDSDDAIAALIKVGGELLTEARKG